MPGELDYHETAIFVTQEDNALASPPDIGAYTWP